MALGFLVLQIWPIFGFNWFFSFRTRRLRFFCFVVLNSLQVFTNLVFGFQFLSTIMAVFRIFLSNAFGEMHDKPSVFSSHYLACNCFQASWKANEITLKQKTISQVSCGWSTVHLECRPSSFYTCVAWLRPVSLSSFCWWKNIALICFVCGI